MDTQGDSSQSERAKQITDLKKDMSKSSVLIALISAASVALTNAANSDLAVVDIANRNLIKRQVSSSGRRQLLKRNGDAFSGEGTFYYPAGGYGSCGTRLQNNDAICALSFAQIESIPCGSCLRVTGPKGSVVVKVMDKCEGCKWGDVDLSHGAFIQIADESVGRLRVSSVVVDCNSGNAAPQQPATPVVLNAASAVEQQPRVADLSSIGKCQSAADCQPGFCCSKFGYCGVGPEYCSGTVGTNAQSTTANNSQAADTAGRTDLAPVTEKYLPVPAITIVSTTGGDIKKDKTPPPPPPPAQLPQFTYALVPILCGENSSKAGAVPVIVPGHRKGSTRRTNDRKRLN